MCKRGYDTEKMTSMWQDFCNMSGLHGVVYLRKGNSICKK